MIQDTDYNFGIPAGTKIHDSLADATSELKATEATIKKLSDPTSYQGDKAVSVAAGLTVGVSVLGFVAANILLPMFGINIGNLGIGGGLNLTHLLYGAGAVGALTGTAVMASSLARAKEPNFEKLQALNNQVNEFSLTSKETVEEARTGGMQHFKRNAALFLGAMTIVGLPLAMLYNAQAGEKKPLSLEQTLQQL